MERTTEQQKTDAMNALIDVAGEVTSAQLAVVCELASTCALDVEPRDTLNDMRVFTNEIEHNSYGISEASSMMKKCRELIEDARRLRRNHIMFNEACALEATCEDLHSHLVNLIEAIGAVLESEDGE